MRAWLTLTLAGAALWGAGGCLQDQRYVLDNEAVALTADSAPVVQGEDEDALFIAERRFEFPIKAPSDAVRQQLRAEARRLDLPYRRAPWVARDDLAIEVDWALANLDPEPLEVLVTLNGINEFHEYAPGPEDFNQWERRVLLDGRARTTGTITQEQMDEVAVDLATVPAAPNSNLVVYFANHSRLDERVRPYIPARVPGLVGFRAGVVTSRASDVVLELSVRVTDRGGRLAEPGSRAWRLPTPELFTPVVPVEEP